MQTLTINKNDSGQRLDKYLTKALPLLPPSLMYKFIRTKKIKVNRKRAENNYMLCEGDTVELFIKDEFFDKDPDNAYLVLNPKLDIVYEDEDLLFVNKYPGMLCHSGDGNEESENVDTLINNIKAYLYRKGEYKPEEENSFVPALCNRIDRNTGGIVIAAKNAGALRDTNEKIRDGKVDKYYLCAVHGKMEKESDTLTGYLKKDSAENKVEIYTSKPKNDRDVKSIITKYKVLAYKNGLSLLEIELVTGRTHQIRAHMASIGHPLLGDGKYGTNRADRSRGYKYQALYSYRIVLDGKEYKIEPDENKMWFLKEFYYNK